MSYVIRPISPAEAEPFFQAQASSFGFEYRPENLELSLKLGEFDRTTSAWDGAQVVGTAGIWSFEISVPGGQLPCAGVTWVSVRPTHRRQGILSAMMRHQLDAIHERGEPIAALWASEAIIYGRFGYGLAAEGVEMKIDRTRTALRSSPDVPGRTRFITREDAIRDWPKVYDRVRATQPGLYTRHGDWWNRRIFRNPERPRPGFGTSFLVQYEEHGEPLGYVRYRLRESDQDGSATTTLLIWELMAATDSAYAGLWQYVFGVDLIGTIQAEWRRTDEPLTHMLADPRRLVRRTQDALWVRIMDVPKALGGRAYSAPGELVIEVRDQFCAWNEGRYVLEAGPDGAAHCARTDRTAELTLNADDLGAIYMGGVRPSTLAQAGRVTGTAEALRRADAMFAWSPAPWAAEVF